jgi:Rrf2 family cysteine metabolism transcriptional repressor
MESIMAGISTKSLYGVVATHYIYKHQSQGALKIAQICQALQLPQNYLEQILLILKKGGILKSLRGAHGGYLLKKEAQEISVLEIIEILDGTLFEVPQGGERKCELLGFWSNMKSSVQNLFDIPITKLDEYKEELISYTI